MMKTQVSGKCHLWPNVGVGDAKTYLWRPDYHSTALLLAKKQNSQQKTGVPLSNCPNEKHGCRFLIKKKRNLLNGLKVQPILPNLNIYNGHVQLSHPTQSPSDAGQLVSGAQSSLLMLDLSKPWEK